jgi:hypothetical protein
VTARRFKLGDRVKIVRAGHPWVGYFGEIVETMPVPGFDWQVALESDDAMAGHRAGCSELDLRRAAS